MDRTLRRELDAIARDNHSGASELAQQSSRSVLGWIGRSKSLRSGEVLEVADALLEIQQSMAPILRLANELMLVAEPKLSRRALSDACRQFLGLLETAPDRIAIAFRRARMGKRPWKFATYSYSATVIKAFTGYPAQAKEVWCSESRPANEGRKTAEQLAAAEIPVYLSTDASLLSSSAGIDTLVLGADAILHGGFVCKIGADVLVREFASAKKRIWILADTSKFWPEGALGPRYLSPRWGPASEVWQAAPDSVTISNTYFRTILWPKNAEILTEEGWLTPAKVSARLK